MRSLVIILFVLGSCARHSDQTTFEKIEALKLNAIEGKISVLYSDGFQDKAAGILNLLQYSGDFFEDRFGLRESYSVAVIDSANWVKITRIPYGLPFVSGPPNIVCLPADTDNSLSRIVADAIKGHDLNKKFGITNEEIVNLFVSLIGFHELGHIYARAYGIEFPNKWTFEFAATYFAYIYLHHNFPDKAKIWVEVGDRLIKSIDPGYTTLKDFEEKYFRVGVENYAWYQAVFLQRVKAVYEIEGDNLPAQLKDQKWQKTSSTHYLHEMEALAPGFKSWALHYNLIK